jgi:hypothetical protein
MPIPPTKPTPPTPPTMNTISTATNGDDAHTPSPSTPNSTNSKKADPAGNIKNTDGAPANLTTKTSAEKSNSSATDKAAAPSQAPLGNYKETSSQTSLTPIASAATKKTSASAGFGFLFSFILLIAIAFTCYRLWKNNNKQQRTILDYSVDSPKELLNLMNSSAATPPLPQTLLKKNKAAAKIKSNFEVRI